MSVRFIKHGQKVANQILKLIARELSEFKNKTVVVKTSIAKQIIAEAEETGNIESELLKNGNTLFCMCFNDRNFTYLEMVKTKKRYPEKPHSSYLIIKAQSERFKLKLLTDDGVYTTSERVYITHKDENWKEAKVKQIQEHENS